MSNSEVIEDSKGNLLNDKIVQSLTKLEEQGEIKIEYVTVNGKKVKKYKKKYKKK